MRNPGAAVCRATSLISGGLLAIAGFDPESVGAGAAAPEVVYKLKVLVIASQGIGLLAALILMVFYSLPRERSEQTRAALDARKREESGSR